MTGTPRLLVILTSHAVLGNTGRPTGLWLEELSEPYYIFADAGAEVDIVSIGGGEVPLDPHSLRPEGQNPESVERFLKDASGMHAIRASRKLDLACAEGHDAVFLPGGHGTMWDMPDNPVLATLLAKLWAGGKIVAAVCHGPSGLLGAVTAAGKPIVAGRRVAAFSNSEEDAAGLSGTVPFLLESRLRDLGALYEKGPDFQPFAVRDGNLVTGQNPASSGDVARLILQAVKAGGNR